MSKARKSYEESCRRLQEDYLEKGEIPPMPDHLPGPSDEEPLGVSFFRTYVGEEDDLSNLTLPRTFFGRSEINEVSFKNTDLLESNLCWNDFIDVDFSEAVLTRCDMRSSLFEDVIFDDADLSFADLRRSTFEFCSFENANLEGAIINHDQKEDLDLSDKQIDQVNWTDDEGEEPEGG